MFFQHRLLPGATRSPETARPRQVIPSYHSPTHTAAHGIPGDRTGVAAKLGERRFFKVTLPETARNHYIFCWLNGRALHSGQAERQLNLPSLRFRFFFCSTAVCTIIIVNTWWDRGLLMDRFFCYTLLYCCTSSETACDTNGHVDSRTT